MLDTLLPKKIKSLLDLIRFSKPIGFLLLLWPCYFAMANLDRTLTDLVYWYFLFLVGSFLMRSSGCIINDLIDMEIDKKVERTFNRPLASKEVSIFESLCLLLVFLILSLFILLEFNSTTMVLGMISIPLIIIYPLMKRYTYWPQLFLGIVFNWGVLIVSVEFNGSLSFTFFVLYIGCIFWTLGYDTIYAYQDREDDIKNNIKSTAVIFGDNGKLYVMSFYSIFILIIGYLGYQNSNSLLSVMIALVFLIFLIFYLKNWNLKSKISTKYYFKFNNIIGLFCFMYLVIF